MYKTNRSKLFLVICNPPYVTTSDEELRTVKQASPATTGIYSSWAGGKLGRSSVTDNLIRLLPKILSQKGVCYIVVEQCNQPKDLAEFAKICGLQSSLILKRRAGRELLSVMKLMLI